MTMDELVALHKDPASERMAVLAYRFQGYNAKPGSRVDLCCEVCGHRLSLADESVRAHQQLGWLLICRECGAEVARRSAKPLDASKLMSREQVIERLRKPSTP